MDVKTKEQIRNALRERWDQIGRSSAHEIMDELEGNTPSSEMIDIAQSLEQLGRDTSLAEAERRELLAIERALAKMSAGNFGICEDCGEEIPAKRLMVLPQARLCAGCQAFEERQTARIRPVLRAG